MTSVTIMEGTHGCTYWRVHSFTCLFIYSSFVYLFAPLFTYWPNVTARPGAVTAWWPYPPPPPGYFWAFSVRCSNTTALRRPNVVIHRDLCQQTYEIHLVPPFVYQIYGRPEANDSSVHIVTISVANTAFSYILTTSTTLGSIPSISSRLFFLAWVLN